MILKRKKIWIPVLILLFIVPLCIVVSRTVLCPPLNLYGDYDIGCPMMSDSRANEVKIVLAAVAAIVLVVVLVIVIISGVRHRRLRRRRSR